MDTLLKNLIDLKTIKYSKELNKVARIHKYWSRKAWYIVEDYIAKYSKPGDVVLDAFCGSGSIGLESVLSGRNFIGYDLNPMAIFLTENTLTLDFDGDGFRREANRFEDEIKSQIMKLYQVSGSRYVLYSIKGKNDKLYDALTADYDFKNKLTVYANDKLAAHDYVIPEHLSIPDRAFPEKFYKDRFSYKGVKMVSDMFSARNLFALSLLHNYIQTADLHHKSLFELAFTNTLLHVSKLKAENVRPLSVNNYWIPDDFIEENVIWRFLDRVRNVRLAKETTLKRKQLKASAKSGDYKLFNKSSLQLAEIESNSVDYLITDPPYGDAIQYSELSFIWNCWLQKDFDNTDEVIINPVQDKGVDSFQKQMAEFIENARRVLKPDGFFTLCFQNKEIKIWLEIVQTIKRNGFGLHDIKIYDTFGNPYNKHWAKFSPKSDLYVTFKKARRQKQNKNTELSLAAVAGKIVDFFARNPGVEFDLYKGYDLFVAAVISEVFKGGVVSSPERWDLKKVVEIFETKKLAETRLC